MRPTDEKMAAIKMIVCYLYFPGGGGTPSHAGLTRRHRNQEGNVGKSLYCGSCQKEQVRYGKQAKDGLVSIVSASSGV